MNHIQPLLVFVLAIPGLAQEPTVPSPAPPNSEAPPDDGTPTELVDMSLEDLMGLHIEVTSVTKHAQPIASAPAAIFVLTNEDIRRSGARSLPEALRMVPASASRGSTRARGLFPRAVSTDASTTRCSS